METKKSDTIVQFVHPQTRAQRNRVRKRRHFRCSNVLALSSKMRALHSYQTNHIKQARTIFQMVGRCFPNQFLPLKKKSWLTLASPTGSQTLQKLHTIRHERTYNEEEGGPLIPHRSSQKLKIKNNFDIKKNLLTNNYRYFIWWVAPRGQRGGRVKPITSNLWGLVPNHCASP